MTRPAENIRDLHSDLRCYRRYLRELGRIEQRLAALGTISTVQTSVSENFRKQMRRVYGLPPTDEVRRLKARRKELWTVTSMVEFWVSTIEDERVRAVFRGHFLEGMTYAELSRELGVKPETARKIVQRKLRTP